MTSYPGFRVASKQSENAAKLIWPEDCRMVSLWHEKTSLISRSAPIHLEKGREEAISRTSKHFDADYCSIECWTLGARIDSLKVVTAAVSWCGAQLSPALSSSQHSPALGARAQWAELNGCKLCINQHLSANNLIRGNRDGDSAR